MSICGWRSGKTSWMMNFTNLISVSLLLTLQYYQAVSEQLQEHAAWKLAIQISTLEACNPEELFSKEMKQLVEHALSKLPEKTRRAFMMSRYENKSMKEIAESLNVTVKGVDYHIGKALQALRKNLKDYLYTLLFF